MSRTPFDMPSPSPDIETAEDRAGRSRGVQSVEVSVAILDALARGGGPMSLKDISAGVGMPAAKVHRYLASFIEVGMVEQRRSGTYDLGKRALQIGIAAIGRSDFVNRAADRLEALVDRTGVTAQLSVWGDKGPTIIRWQRAAIELTTTLGLGSVLPPAGSATGYVFLAFLPRRVSAPHIETWLAQSGTGMSRQTLDGIIDAVRRDGHAWVDQTFIPGLYAISAPVLNWQGEIETAITLISRHAGLIAPDGAALSALKAVTGQISETGSNGAATRAP